MNVAPSTAIGASSTLVLALALAVTVASTTAFAAGCTSGEVQGDAPGRVAFVREAQGEGATVSLHGRPDPFAPNRMVIDVVARGVADVHGAAFRVTWDSEALGFVEATSGPVWSKTALALAKEGAPGQLAVAWTEKGEVGTDATGETVLGTLVFDVKGRKGTSIAFKTERSQLVGRKGARVDVSWLGGSLPAR